MRRRMLQALFCFTLVVGSTVVTAATSAAAPAARNRHAVTAPRVHRWAPWRPNRQAAFRMQVCGVRVKVTFPVNRERMRVAGLHHHYVAQQFKGRLVVKFTPMRHRLHSVRWDISGASLGRHTTRAYESGRYVFAATGRNLVFTNAQERRRYHLPVVFLARGPIRIVYTKHHVARLTQRPRDITDLCRRLGVHHQRAAGTDLARLRTGLPADPASAVLPHAPAAAAPSPSLRDTGHWVFYQWSSIEGWRTPNALAMVTSGGWVAWFYWSSDPGYRAWEVEYTILASNDVSSLLSDVGCIDFGATLYWLDGSYRSWYPYGDNNVWYHDCGGGFAGPEVLFWPGDGFSTPVTAYDFAYKPTSLVLSMGVSNDSWGRIRDQSDLTVAVPSANY